MGSGTGFGSIDNQRENFILNSKEKEEQKEEIGISITNSNLNSEKISQNEKKKAEQNKQINVSNTNQNNLNYTEQSTEILLNKTITQNDIDSGPNLVIKETEGNQLSQGSIELNAAGCEIGERQAKDGVTLFGPTLTDEKNNIINDILIAPNFKDINSHLFVIYYRKDEKKYYIRTYKDQLSNGLSVLLVKIKKTFLIKKSEMIMIGDLFFVFLLNISNSYKILTITKLSCKRSPEEEKKLFTSEKFMEEGKVITIGRDKKSTMSYPNDKSFSKVHATIYFNTEINEWEIKDGTEEKSSTNGVWVIPKHSLEIYDNMTFKIMGCSKFLVTLISK